MATKGVTVSKGQMKPKGRRQEAARKAETFCKKKHIHFSKQECERLLQLYKEFTRSQTTELKTKKQGIDRNTFRDILHRHFNITDDIIMDKIFKALDIDNDGLVNEEEWVSGMSIYLRGTLEERARFCFGVYCFQGDEGYLMRENMFQLLKHCMVHQVTEEDPDECPKDLVECCIKKMDLDHDGRLSCDDYVKSVKEESLLIEALGSCLPNRKAKEAFLEMVADEVKPGHGGNV